MGTTPEPEVVALEEEAAVFPEVYTTNVVKSVGSNRVAFENDYTACIDVCIPWIYGVVSGDPEQAQDVRSARAGMRQHCPPQLTMATPPVVDTGPPLQIGTWGHREPDGGSHNPLGGIVMCVFHSWSHAMANEYASSMSATVTPICAKQVITMSIGTSITVSSDQRMGAKRGTGVNPRATRRALYTGRG
ncbi:hypothetical protein B0H17DRAFT_1132939 [Mycena rosella]|uniref:Uncharacterized protein n=1 Tax=Mycena rosella TaxID=1033263 RepID=A0AAD7DIQ8_MYCRO|nr:hypothetical protein B0H17DRAFT_1132939 [Mycena rosella]